jgi:hypothetical protein
MSQKAVVWTYERWQFGLIALLAVLVYLIFR